MSDVFSAADLATPVARPEATVHLPGIGKTLRLLAWSAETGIKVDALSDKVKAGADPAELFSAMIVPSVIDGQGKTVFTVATFKTWLAKVGRDDVLALVKAVGELNKPPKAEAPKPEGEASPPTDA